MIISVWGTDIYTFPNSSCLLSSALKFSLSRADKILSTSKTMKEETKKFTSKEIIVTPFGIDINNFFPQKMRDRFFRNGDIVIGTIKTLKKIMVWNI